MSKEYKIPCSWQMYGYLDVEAESWDEAIEKAEDNGTPLPTDGSYVEASFEVDHDIIEFEREEERQKIRKKVDAGFPTGNDADFGASME
jgi:hypothetical protein